MEISNVLYGCQGVEDLPHTVGHHNGKIVSLELKLLRQIANYANPGLLMDKYLVFTDEVLGRPVAKSAKQMGIEQVEFTGNQSAYNQRKLHSVRLRRYYKDAYVFSLETACRLVTGMGESSVIETHLTLHPLYGFPVLLGASLKGLAAHWGADHPEYADKASWKEIFGFPPFIDAKGNRKQGSEGSVIFLDAWPKDISRKLLTVDVLTNHHMKYYSSNGGQSPKESDEPNPVPFLTVCKGVPFVFGLRTSDWVPVERQRTLLTNAKGILEKALMNYGVGGKSSSGYGYFRSTAST